MRLTAVSAAAASNAPSRALEGAEGPRTLSRGLAIASTNGSCKGSMRFTWDRGARLYRRMLLIVCLLLWAPCARSFSASVIGNVGRTTAGANQGYAAPKCRPLIGLRRAVCSAQRAEGEGVAPAYNVLGMDLQCCCSEVRDTGIGTGFFRDGHCSTGPTDQGKHTVCVHVCVCVSVCAQ